MEDFLHDRRRGFRDAKNRMFLSGRFLLPLLLLLLLLRSRNGCSGRRVVSSPDASSTAAGSQTNVAGGGRANVYAASAGIRQQRRRGRSAFCASHGQCRDCSASRTATQKTPINGRRESDRTNDFSATHPAVTFIPRFGLIPSSVPPR